jgi:hypothetical protein
MWLPSWARSSMRRGDDCKPNSMAAGAGLVMTCTGSAKRFAPASDCSPTRQKHRLNSVFAADNHAALLVCWQFYQDTIAAYAAHPRKGKKLMGRLIDTLASTIPNELKELRSLRTTFQRRRADILAYFDHPGTSNGPTEAINGRLEHLRGIALGFRNRGNYLIRSLLHAGGLAASSTALFMKSLYSVRKHRIGTIAEVHYRDSVAKSRADNPLSKPSKADSGLVGHTYFLPSPAQSVLRAVTFRRKRSTVIGDNSCHCPDSRTSMPRSAYEWFQTRFRFAIATGNE